MKFLYNPAIKFISIIVLWFFTWTFGGIFDIAYAIKNSDELGVLSSKIKGNQTSSHTNQPQKPRPEEKFQKAIEDIEQALIDTSLDTDKKKNRLKTKKAEIDSFDSEIRKQFAETEKKLRDEGLSGEILERHHKFVRHYDDNLKELRNNLNAIDKAKDSKEVEAKVQETKRHLEKVKPPKKHRPLDPNKLPHRTMEPVFIEPRTAPEEFLKDSQHSLSPTLAKGGKGGFSNNPILIASNGSLNGLLSAANEPILLAALTPPASSDLAETIEVQLTPAIQAKAAELNHNPTKIYNWVRNTIEYVPTYGSIQGANMCLQTKQCSDFDTASLLIAL
ncbi:MAG: transglutaminase, partial [Nitrospirae bacterium]|nr:transglutaminase [Nitrospirota bacterium]